MRSPRKIVDSCTDKEYRIDFSKSKNHEKSIRFFTCNDGGDRVRNLFVLGDRLMTAFFETPVPELKNMFHFPPEFAEDRQNNVEITAR